MKAIILLCSLTLFMNAMDNNNVQTSHLTYESYEDKDDACILHVPKSKFEVKENMTFVHKKGIPISETDAIFTLLDSHSPTVLSKIENPVLIFLNNRVQLSDIYFLPSLHSKFTNPSLSFKKPQIRIIEKVEKNREEFGSFGKYVDTDFLQMKVAATCLIEHKYQNIVMHFYVSGKKDSLTIIPYKVHLPSISTVRADKEVRYF